jgi:hypothetical protein
MKTLKNLATKISSLDAATTISKLLFSLAVISLTTVLIINVIELIKALTK